MSLFNLNFDILEQVEKQLAGIEIERVQRLRMSRLVNNIDLMGETHDDENNFVGRFIQWQSSDLCCIVPSEVIGFNEQFEDDEENRADIIDVWTIRCHNTLVGMASLGGFCTNCNAPMNCITSCPIAVGRVGHPECEIWCQTCR